MKKGDTYIGSSGLRLVFGDKKKTGWEVQVERRQIDRSTGEVKIIKNKREVPDDTLKYLLLDYTLESR